MEQTTTQGKQEQPTTTQSVRIDGTNENYQDKVTKFFTRFQAAFNSLGERIENYYNYNLFQAVGHRSSLTINAGSDTILSVEFNPDRLVIKDEIENNIALFEYDDVDSEKVILNFLRRNYNKVTLEATSISEENKSDIVASIANELDQMGVPKKPEAVHINTEEPRAWVAKDEVKTPWPSGTISPDTAFGTDYYGVSNIVNLEYPVYGLLVEIKIISDLIPKEKFEVELSFNTIHITIPMYANVGDIAGLGVETFKKLFGILGHSIRAKGHLEAHVAHFTNSVWNHLEAYRKYEEEISKQETKVQQAAV